MPKLLIFDAFTLLFREKKSRNYALLQCKILSLNIRRCKILDKYHVFTANLYQMLSKMKLLQKIRNKSAIAVQCDKGLVLYSSVTYYNTEYWTTSKLGENSSLCLCHQVVLKSFLSCRDHVCFGNPERHEEPEEKTNDWSIYSTDTCVWDFKTEIIETSGGSRWSRFH